MTRLFLLTTAIAVASTGVSVAKPLITSSEETPSRLCLARQEAPARIVDLCDRALMEARLTENQRADLLVAQGDGFLWQNDFVKAEAAYRRAAQINPLEVEAWNGLGWSLWELQGDQAAYEAFDRSLSISVTVQGLGGKAALARRMGTIDSDTAREMLRAALAIDPDYIWAVRELGWSFIDESRNAEAIAAFQDALDIEPRDTNARYGLGRAHLSAGHAEDALTIFNELLVDTPQDFPTLVYRIVALRNLDRNAQAVRLADRLIEAFPDRASGYVEKGQALAALERRNEAIQTYVQAEKHLGPDNAVLYWHADVLVLDGRLDEAMAVIDRGIHQSGVDYSDHLLKSYIALQLQDYATARSSAEASLAMGVNDPWAHYYIAITLIHDGQVDAGLARFDNAIQAGLPAERVGAFASELAGAGKYVEAVALRLKY
jgi:tetratricopeptide (TPR) repeat protein